MDHEYVAILPEVFEGDGTLVIAVDKTGGGTLGSYYTGTWECKLYRDGECIAQADDLHTGTAKRHDQVAAIFADFAYEEFQGEDDWPTGDRLSYWAHVLMTAFMD